MSDMELPRLLKGANARSVVLVVMLSACGLLSIVGGIALLGQASLLEGAANGASIAPAVATANDARIELIGSAQQISAIITALAWLLWLHWAYRAMRAMGAGGSEVSPGWAIGYWFVPIVNLYRPYRIVRETLARSAQGNGADFALEKTNTTIVGLWWATWLLSNGLTRVASSEFTAAKALPDLISATNALIGVSVVGLLAAALAIAVVRRINRAQQSFIAPQIVALENVNTPGGRRRRLALGAAIGLIGAVTLWAYLNRSSTSPVLSAPEIAERARAAIVQIRALGADRKAIAEGTGFFIARNGLIATNLHVIRDGSALEVESTRGDIYDIVYFITADARRDIAILKVPVDDATPLAIADEAELAVGEPVFVMGNPLGQVGTFSNGLVSAHRVLEGVTLMQITAPISPGSSGGPVMNSAGKVVGLATLMLREGQNLNYAVPTRYVRPLIGTPDVPQRFSQAVLLAAVGENAESTERASEPTAPNRPRRGAAVNRDEIGPQFRNVDSLVRAGGGSVLSEIVRGDLAEARENRHPVNMVAGKIYLIAAYCDNDCVDLDLVLEGPGGLPVQTDTENNDSPLIRVEAKESGEYKLVVRMVKCSVEPCGYGVRLYRLMR